MVKTGGVSEFNFGDQNHTRPHPLVAGDSIIGSTAVKLHQGMHHAHAAPGLVGTLYVCVECFVSFSFHADVRYARVYL